MSVEANAKLDLTIEIPLGMDENKEIEVPEVPRESTASRRNSLFDGMKDKMNDQDFMQKIKVSGALMFEFYRVMMGAMLIIFVPQKCGEHVCSMSENITREDGGMSEAAFIANLVTLATFLVMYYFEVKRENALINNLEVNTDKPRSSEAVGEHLMAMPEKLRELVWGLDHEYQITAGAAMVCFLANTGLSLIPIMDHYLDSKTISVLATNVMFMGLKLVDVYSTTNTEKNVFYSAFMTRKVQFNDVDPDVRIKDVENPTKDINSEDPIAAAETAADSSEHHSNVV